MDVVHEGISILREEGLSEFLSRVYQYLSWQFIPLRASVAVRRGELSLSAGNTTSQFTATNTASVRRTLRRFHSESDMIEEIVDELESDDIFYDIGANTGLYTCFASKCCEKVIAFEPYPPNLAELKENSRINGENISVFEVALSDQSGTVDFKIERGENTNGPETDSAGFGKGSITKSKGDIEIQSVRGDDLIEQGRCPEPTVVKIDVEGAEPLVIEGLRDGISNESCRLVFCEVHRPKASRGSIHDHGYSESDVIRMFEEMGFDTITKFSDDGSTFVLRAQRGEE